MVSPMITAARPITMVPMPMVISAPPWVCANSAPAKRHQRVGQRHAGHVCATGRDALGPRHTGVGAGGAHRQADFGREEPVEQQLGGDHHDQQYQRALDVVGHPVRQQPC
jgi:hypothetical protein